MWNRFVTAFKKRWQPTDYYDYNLLAVIVLMVCFGLVILYSASSYDAAASAKMQNDSMWYLRHQAPISVASVLGCILLSRFNYHYIAKLAGWVYMAALVLMAMVRFTPLGVEANNSRRWLKLGVTFQPSEIAKIAVIVFIPLVIIKMGKNIKGFKGVAYLLAIGMIQAGGAFFFTDNLSTALIIAAITAVIIFVSHPKTWPFLLVTAGIAAVCAVLYMQFRDMDASLAGSFRLRRILVWMDPEKYSDFGGYQVLQGLYAIGSGGLFGKGLGNSAQKLGPIPEAQNDMIFAIICEELGIFGMVIVLMLFGYMLYRLFFIAQNAPDLYGSLMVVGIMAHISLQVILNICVSINLIPTTGITLPFFSYGGTSIAFLMGELAIALSVSRSIQFREGTEVVEIYNQEKETEIHE
ncbi:MAG: FtsW/RodA/SpoVE family cell cycle protein [Lachnospiraceae bacterium]|nr:FtsW/RodA/SpoVE family cell cycle protein [Lachnospiraceae bacterium]